MAAGGVIGVRHGAAVLMLVAGVFLLRGSAQAQSEFSRAATPSALYPGLNLDYVIEVSTFQRHTATVTLPDHVELISVVARDGGGDQTVFEATTSGCGVMPPYACPGPLSVVGAVALFEVTVDPGSGTDQQVQVVRTDGAEAFWQFRFVLTVRVARGPPCVAGASDEPSAVLSGAPLPPQGYVPAFCADVRALQTVVASAAEVVVHRRNPAQPTAVPLFARTVGGDVPLQGAVQVGCTPAAACAAGATQQVQVFAPTVAPAEVSLAAFNASAPIPGDARVALGVTYDGTFYPDVVDVVVQEQPAASVRLAAPTTPLASGQPLSVTVTEALNADGGFEPPTAESWAVEVVPPPVGVSPAGWLTAPTATGVVLDIPPADLETLRGQPDLTVTVVASHRNPDGTLTSGRLDFTLNPPAARSCKVVASASILGVGDRATLEVRVEESGGETLADFSPTWSLASGAGTLTVDPAVPARAVYAAPSAPTEAEVVVDFPAFVCEQTQERFALRVGRDLAVRLVPAQRNVTAGRLTDLTVEVHNLGRAQDAPVNVILALGAGWQTVGGVPPGALAAVAVGAPELASSTPQADFAMPLPAVGARQGVVVPVLVAPGAGCARATAAVRLIRGDAVVAEASTEVRVRCDTEFTQATVVGRVFVDSNGNGVFDGKELGLDGALVASSESIYARTDPHGRYHLARLAPGRHAFKVDPATLPPGARVRGRATRVVTLTPGGFSAVDFPVALPDLTEASTLAWRAEGSRLEVEHGNLTYRARLEVAPGRRLRAGGVQKPTAEETQTDDDAGATHVTFAVAGAGPRHRLLIEEALDGRVWLSSFAVHHHTADAQGLVLPWGPRPLVRLALPMPGQGIAPGPLPLRLRSEVTGTFTAQTGAHRCERVLRPGLTTTCWLSGKGETLEIAVDAGPGAHGDDPPPLTFQRPLHGQGASHFWVGVGGGQLARVLSGTREDTERPLGWDAYGAFFYRGFWDADTFLTAGAGADRTVWVNRRGDVRSAAGIAARLMGHRPTRVFRDLDPETVFPTWGDGSTTVDEREAGGRFFARLERGDDFVRWGSVNTGFDTVEVGRYVRALYGLGARWQARPDDSDRGAKVLVFGAQPETFPARDEFLTTGGALYFLSHRGLVEGTLRVVVETLDEVSRLPIAAQTLFEGRDYEADYAGGRVVLSRPWPQRGVGGTLSGRQVTGERYRLRVEYEYIPARDRSTTVSAGARGSGHWGPLQLGITGAGELSGAAAERVRLQDADYRLAAADARIDWGDALRVRAEVATSQGRSHAMAASDDGGLSFRASRGASGSGRAAALEVATTHAHGEGQLYARLFEAGYTDSHRAPGARLVQGGLRGTVHVAPRTDAWGQGDYRAERREGAPLDVRTVGRLGLRQRLGRWDGTVEGRYDRNPRQDQNALRVAGEVGVALSPQLRLFGARRQWVVREGFEGIPSESVVGGAYGEVAGPTVQGEGGIDDRGGVFGRLRGGWRTVDDVALYAGYEQRRGPSVWDEVPGERWVAGGRRHVGGTLLYAENAVAREARGGRLSRVVGASVPLSEGTQVSLSYERGGPTEAAAAGRRDAVSLAFDHHTKTWSLALGGEGRVDTQPGRDEAVWGLQGRGEWRPSQGWTLALDLRGATAYRLGAEATVSRWAWEGSVGAAFRPPQAHWLTTFVRYAITTERERPVAAPARSEQSHVVSLAGVVRLPWRLNVAPKVAYRWAAARVSGRAEADALLAVLRAEVPVFGRWDASLEGRVCAEPAGPDAPRAGALAEVGMFALPWLRVGVGYNLSDIAASGVVCRSPGARGMFVRAEAVY